MDRREPDPWRMLEDWGWAAARAWQGQVGVLADSLERARTAAGRTEAWWPVVDRDALGAVRRDYLDLVSRAVALSVGYADDMAALLREAASSMGDDLRRAGGQPWPAATSGRWIPVELSGAVGTTLTTRVTLANRQQRTHDVRIDVGQFSGPDRQFVPSLRMEPEVVTLAPGAESDVALSLDLDPALFRPGEVYTGRVVVRGGDEAVLALTVSTDPSGQG